VISSYPSPTASHIISQQPQGEYGQYPPTSQLLVKQGVSPMPLQKVNLPMGSVIVNPSPSTTPLVDATLLDTIPQQSQQVIINDPNNNNGGVILSNGYQASSLEQDPSNGNIQVLNQTYMPQNQSNPSTPQTSASYQIITNQGCILSPTIQQTQQLPSQRMSMQTTYSQMPTYISQPQTPQSVFINSTPTTNMIYQKTTPPKNVVYQPLPNQLPMQSNVVYTVPPTPTQNVILSPPSQSPVNYYNISPPEYQSGSNF